MMRRIGHLHRGGDGPARPERGGRAVCLCTLRTEVTQGNDVIAERLCTSDDQVVPQIPMSSAQIARDLTDRIRAGEYGEPGSQLPTYAALAGLYSVSESTIAKTILLLRERGVVVGVAGRGTYVAG